MARVQFCGCGTVGCSVLVLPRCVVLLVCSRPLYVGAAAAADGDAKHAACQLSFVQGLVATTPLKFCILFIICATVAAASPPGARELGRALIWDTAGLVPGSSAWQFCMLHAVA